jgi:Zn-dependent membrane protease YugP
MGLFLWDWTIVLLFPALILAIWAQAKVKSAYAKYSKVRARSGMTGAQVAADMLRRGDLVAVGGRPRALEALGAVQVEAVAGELTDHYDPRDKVLRLSEPVYGGDSLAAIGVAAHEAGHAIQDAAGYPALVLRTTLVPAAQLGSGLAFPLFLVGLFFAHSGLRFLMDVGILLFSAAVVFTLVTLPVEFNASRRALRLLDQGGYLAADEIQGARAVLNAAALTYVAAAAMAIMQLLRLILLRGRD